MSVNVANIDKTIARIHANKNFKFDMNNWGGKLAFKEMLQEEHVCGTSACIAGFAVLASGKYPIKKAKNNHGVEFDVLDVGVESKFEQSDLFLRDGAELLGLTERQAATLFTPFTSCVWNEDKSGLLRSPDYFKATADEAIAVLEYLKATGIVDWSKSGIKGDPGFEKTYKDYHNREYLPPVGPDEEKVVENA